MVDDSTSTNFYATYIEPSNGDVVPEHAASGPEGTVPEIDGYVFTIRSRENAKITCFVRSPHIRLST